MLEAPRVDPLAAPREAAAVAQGAVTHAGFHVGRDRAPARTADERRARRAARDRARTGSCRAPGSASGAVAAPDERLTDSRRAPARGRSTSAGLDAAELDLVLVATLSQDELTPEHRAARRPRSSAPIAPARSTSAPPARRSCRAGSLAAAQIEAGRARRRAASIGADFITRITDYDDKRTAPLFGDGAGAAVLGAVRRRARRSIGPIVLGADGSQRGGDLRRAPDRKLRMDGQEVFRNAVSRMTRGDARRRSQRAGLTLDDIDLFVYHQANARITRALGERLGLPGRARRRLHRAARQLVGRDAPAGAVGGRARRAPATGRARAAQRVRRRASPGAAA